MNRQKVIAKLVALSKKLDGWDSAVGDLIYGVALEVSKNHEDRGIPASLSREDMKLLHPRVPREISVKIGGVPRHRNHVRYVGPDVYLWDREDENWKICSWGD